MSDLETTPKTQESTAVAAKTADAVQRVQAALTIARHAPRDELKAIERIKTSCRRIRLAEVAMYAYPRGGKVITGPSIRLAEVLAQAWGNMDTGVRELEQHEHPTEGYSVAEAWAWDLESNFRDSRTFTVKHKIQLKGGKVKNLRDPRDVYELVANQGSRRKRATILAIIPRDVIEDAVAWCTATLKKGDGKPLKDRIKDMVLAFSDLQVTKEMLEKHLANSADIATEDQLVELRSIYMSMKDGQSKRADWFEFDTPSEGGKAEEINDKFKKTKG